MKSAMLECKLEKIREVLVTLKDKKDCDSILEFGVYGGYSLSEITLFIKNNQMTNQIWGFDCFKGLPLDEGRWKKGDFACSKNEVDDFIFKKIGKFDYPILIEAYYNELDLSLRDRIQKVSFIHIDCDLYQSTIDALLFCEPLLKEETYICFDEWYEGPEEKAWLEFIKDKNIKWDKIGGVEYQNIIQIKK